MNPNYLNREKYLKALKKIDDRQECLHPNASKENCNHFISAHTIQKEGALRNISKKGNVIWIDFNPMILMNHGGPKFKKIGISNASTLNIFCNKHDTELFQPIETSDIDYSLQQIFVYSYRAISREIRGKKSLIESFDFQINDADQIKNLIERTIKKKYFRSLKKQAKYGLNDFNHFKNRYDQRLLNNDFNDVKYYLIEFEDPIPTVSCGAASPEMDFHGNDILSIKNPHEIPEIFSFNLECTADRSFALFSWLGEQKSCTKFIQSLHSLANSKKEHALFRYLLEYYENFFMNPEWFNQLKDEEKEYLLRRAISNDGKTRTEKSLLDDGVRIINWKVKDIRSNLTLSTS